MRTPPNSAYNTKNVTPSFIQSPHPDESSAKRQKQTDNIATTTAAEQHDETTDDTCTQCKFAIAPTQEPIILQCNHKIHDACLPTFLTMPKQCHKQSLFMIRNATEQNQK